MLPRRSLSLPIILAIVMIALLVALTVGWISLAVLGVLRREPSAGFYWTLLIFGTMFIVLLLAGVIVYLVLSIKAINLNLRQSNFIDSVTHELKSPIASLKLYLQTLRRRQVRKEERLDFYRFMLDDLERLDKLINQLLEAGRVEADRLMGEVEQVNVPRLLQQCGENVCKCYSVAPEVIDFQLQPCTVWARETDLTIIFRNLLDNAVKYAGGSPQVHVQCHCAESRVLVRIADNGRGIPPRLRRKVFGRFVRLGLELERIKPGTGLGLHIVHTLVRRLRGRITIHGREPEAGTVFEVELPRGTPERKPP